MQTKDINGIELVRGDFVQLEHTAFVLDSTLPRTIGQVIHVFVNSKDKGIHINFGDRICVANNGVLLRKVN